MGWNKQKFADSSIDQVTYDVTIPFYTAACRAYGLYTRGDA